MTRQRILLIGMCLIMTIGLLVPPAVLAEGTGDTVELKRAIIETSYGTTVFSGEGDFNAYHIELNPDQLKGVLAGNLPTILMNNPNMTDVLTIQDPGNNLDSYEWADWCNAWVYPYQPDNFTLCGSGCYWTSQSKYGAWTFTSSDRLATLAQWYGTRQTWVGVVYWIPNVGGWIDYAAGSSSPLEIDHTFYGPTQYGYTFVQNWSDNYTTYDAYIYTLGVPH